MQRAFIVAKDKEFEGWSQREIDAGIAKLVEQIEAGADWDDDGDYKLEMAEHILLINFGNKIDYEDKWFDIQGCIDQYVLRWAIDEVTCNPDKYCEVILPNDDL